MSRTITAAGGAITLTNTLDNTVTLTSTANLTASSRAAMYGQGGVKNSWTIDNSGTVIGSSSIVSGTTVSSADGMRLGFNVAVTSGVLINRSGGTIAGVLYGVFIAGPASVTNMSGATISAVRNTGVYTRGVATVVNYGVISNGAGPAIYEASGGSVVNKAGATISGGTFGIRLVAASTVTNAGTVNAAPGGYALYFQAPTITNRLIVNPGASFAGAINLGTGVMELASSASVGTLSGFGTAITNFSTLAFDTGAHWKLTGSAKNFGGTGITPAAITGFAAGDTISRAIRWY
jgi:hypothetical protein